MKENKAGKPEDVIRCGQLKNTDDSYAKYKYIIIYSITKFLNIVQEKLSDRGILFAVGYNISCDLQEYINCTIKTVWADTSLERTTLLALFP